MKKKYLVADFEKLKAVPCPCGKSKRAFLSKDRFSSLALIGIASILLAHAFINTAMTVGLIPVKGLPFPFISAGGSFLITSYMMVGLAINLSVNYSD